MYLNGFGHRTHVVKRSAVPPSPRRLAPALSSGVHRIKQYLRGGWNVLPAHLDPRATALGRSEFARIVPVPPLALG